MKSKNDSKFVIVFILLVFLFLFFGGGAMTSGMMKKGGTGKRVDGRSRLDVDSHAHHALSRNWDRLDGVQKAGLTGSILCKSGSSIEMSSDIAVDEKGGIMKRRIAAFAVIGIVVGSFVSGCGTTSEQRPEYREEWPSFKHETGRTIEANEKRIDAFKEKLEMASADTKARYSKDVAALEQKNRELRKKLDGYRDQGRIPWEQFKASFMQEMDGVGKTMKDLFNDSH